jgi:hypothetical protein
MRSTTLSVTVATLAIAAATFLALAPDADAQRRGSSRSSSSGSAGPTNWIPTAAPLGAPLDDGMSGAWRTASGPRGYFLMGFDYIDFDPDPVQRINIDFSYAAKNDMRYGMHIPVFRFEGIDETKIFAPEAFFAFTIQSSREFALEVGASYQSDGPDDEVISQTGFELFAAVAVWINDQMCINGSMGLGTWNDIKAGGTVVAEGESTTSVRLNFEFAIDSSMKLSVFSYTDPETTVGGTPADLIGVRFVKRTAGGSVMSFEFHDLDDIDETVIVFRFQRSIG